MRSLDCLLLDRSRWLALATWASPAGRGGDLAACSTWNIRRLGRLAEGEVFHVEHPWGCLTLEDRAGRMAVRAVVACTDLEATRERG